MDTTAKWRTLDQIDVLINRLKNTRNNLRDGLVTDDEFVIQLIHINSQINVLVTSLVYSEKDRG